MVNEGREGGLLEALWTPGFPLRGAGSSCNWKGGGFPSALPATSHLPAQVAFNLPVYLLVALPGRLLPFSSIAYRFC